MSIFMKAAENDLEFVKLNFTHLEMVDERKKSLLHYAVLGSAMDVIHYLLDMDINVNMVDEHGETPLFDCARKGKLDIAKLLLTKFANVNLENHEKHLRKFISKRHLEHLLELYGIKDDIMEHRREAKK